MESFGKTLKDERKAKKITLREISKNVQKSISYLSDVEHDRKGPPNLETVRKIEEAIGIADNKLLNLALTLRKSAMKNMTQRIKMKPTLSELLLRADELPNEELADLIETIKKRRDE